MRWTLHLRAEIRREVIGYDLTGQVALIAFIILHKAFVLTGNGVYVMSVVVQQFLDFKHVVLPAVFAGKDVKAFNSRRRDGKGRPGNKTATAGNFDIGPITHLRQKDYVFTAFKRRDFAAGEERVIRYADVFADGGIIPVKGKICHLSLFRQGGRVDIAETVMILVDGILDQNPVVFLAENLDPAVGGNRGLAVAAAQGGFIRRGINGILLSAFKLDVRCDEFGTFGEYRRLGQAAGSLFIGLRQGRKVHIAQVPLESSFRCAGNLAQRRVPVIGDDAFLQHHMVKAATEEADQIPLAGGIMLIGGEQRHGFFGGTVLLKDQEGAFIGLLRHIFVNGIGDEHPDVALRYALGSGEVVLPAVFRRGEAVNDIAAAFPHEDEPAGVPAGGADNLRIREGAVAEEFADLYGERLFCTGGAYTDCEQGKNQQGKSDELLFHLYGLLYDYSTIQREKPGLQSRHIKENGRNGRKTKVAKINS